MRRLAKAVLWLVVVVVVALGVAWVMIDRIAKAGIERGTEYALGVEATVDDVGVNLLSGRFTMDGLTLGNPEGFTTPHFMKSGHFELEVKTGTLLEETVEVEKFELDGLDVYIEWKGLDKTNVSVITDRLKTGEGKEPAEKEGGKKLRVKEIVIRNVVAHLKPAVGGELPPVEVPEIVLHDVTSDEAEGVVVSELTRRLVPVILEAVLKQGGGIPGDLAKSLERDLGNLDEALGEASKVLGEVGKEVGKALEGLLGGKKGEEGSE